LTKGNVFVAFDTTDFAKSCLVDESSLASVSALCQHQQQSKDGSVGCNSDQGLIGLLVLSPPSSSAPELLPTALDASIESLQSHNRHALTETARTRAENAKIKAEKEDRESGPKQVVPRTDWAKAYETFFHIIMNKRNQLSKTDLATSLPQIESIIDIAQKYDAIRTVQNAFTSLLLGYIEHDTLYPTIASEPERCLKVGIALQSRLVYDEAFKHLVGKSANFKAGMLYAGLCFDVQAIVRRRSQELFVKEMLVMTELLLITLPAEIAGEPAPDYPTAVVSQHEQPEAYCITSIFRDWMSEHIGYLGKEPATSKAAVKKSYLCSHETGCTTVAGFFRIIMAGGDSYLPTEKVLEDWDGGSLTIDDAGDELGDVMKKALTTLKTAAANHLRDLVGSELQLRDRHTLDYLTCVKVGAEDVPWDSTEQDGESDEEMEED
jgi:hypothetical protein